jgi:heavy metal sensor kinase
VLGPTLRFRMIFLFCAVIGLFLAGTYWIGYEIFAHEVRTALDEKLLDIGRLLAEQLDTGIGAQQFTDLQLENQFVERIGPNGTVLQRSPGLDGVPLSLAPLPSSEKSQFQTLPTSVGMLRAVLIPIVVDGQRQWLIVAESTFRVDGIERSFRENAFGLWTVSLLLTTMIAAWYVGRSLAPVVELNRHASLLTQRIGETSQQDLEPRLPVQNPNDELGRLAINFNELFFRVSAGVRQLRQFVSDAAHELRTPLSVLHGETQLLLSQRRSVSEYQHTLRTIDSELTVMVQIVEGLFTLAMADAGQLKIQNEYLHLDEVLEEACGIAAPLARRKQISIERTSWMEVQFRGDQILLRQVFLILLENAIKYSPSGTRIQVGITCSRGRPEVFVQDEGIGISPEHLSHIFERFYRAAPQHGDEPRSGGLGLSIADAIMRAHGGAVHCTSEVDKGSMFTLVFHDPRDEQQPEPSIFSWLAAS